jgi:hypothetical protein
MGGNFNLPMVQWIYKRMTIEGFMTGTLRRRRELMDAGAKPARSSRRR